MNRLGSCTAVLLLLSNVALASNGLYAVKVSPPSDQPEAAVEGRFYLAPELMVAQQAEAQVVGQNRQGDVVLRTENPAELLATEAVRATNKVDPNVEKIEPVELLIGFRQGQQQAVVEALKKAGFEIVRVSERAKYVVVKGTEQAKGEISP